MDDFPPLTELRRETREDYDYSDWGSSEPRMSARLAWNNAPPAYTGEQLLPEILPLNASSCYPVKSGIDEKKIIADLEHGFTSVGLNFIRNGDRYVWEVSTKPVWHQMQRIIEVHVYRVLCESGYSLTVQFLNFAGAHGFDRAGTYDMIDQIAIAADLDMTVSINPWYEKEVWSIFE